MAPGPATPVRLLVIWNGISDVNASYQLERSLTEDTSSRNFRPHATVAPSARLANGTFEYDDGPAGRIGGRFICYRVRAVVLAAPGPYSTETCIGPIPSTGPGVDASPTAAVPPPASPTPRPPDTGARAAPESDGVGSNVLWVAGLLSAAGTLTAASFVRRRR